MKKLFCLVFASIMLILALSSCDVINEIFEKKEPVNENLSGCEHEWSEANCKAAKTCRKCGKTEGELGDHRFSKTTCTENSICIDCGLWNELAYGHDYSSATCTSPRICKTCGLEKGEPEHDYSEATCLESKVCSLCGAVDGKPLGHKLTTAVIEPTCSKDGYNKVSCSRCDYSYTENIVSMLGHDDLSFVYNGDATASKDGTATASCPYCDYSVTESLVGSASLIADAFAGKKISILGDSISTYVDVTSGIAADTTNSTIRNNIVWYGYSPSQPAFGGTSVDSTWWQIVINSLGATRLVNNSNAGESVFQAVTDRCMQLHDDTGDNAVETPDIIFVYLGTNDNNRTMGSVSNLNMADIERHGDDPDYQPSTLIEAYAIMIYRIQKTYPNAEIFCLTNLERSDQRKELTHAVSQVIRDVVDLYDGVYLADIGAFSGITLDNPKYETYMPKDAGNKSLHPGAEGMKEIARVTLTSIIENSKYMTGDIYDLMPEYGG